MKPITVEVGSRPATDEETPEAAVRMRALAVAAGWSVRATYARAWRGDRPTESLALRMSHRERGGAVAVWVDGKFNVGYRGDQSGWRRIPANVLKRWVRDGS